MRLLVVLLIAVAPGTVASAPRVAAQVPLLTITEVTGSGKSVAGTGGRQVVDVSCPHLQVPLSGYVSTSAPLDVRREYESFTMTADDKFEVGLINFGADPVLAWATARCVSTLQLGQIQTVTGQFNPAADHVAEGTVTCPTGHVAINASVTELFTPDRTLLTTSPTPDTSGWFARGWIGDLGDPAHDLYIRAHCVQRANLPAGMLTASHFDGVGWGVPATATCPSGLVPAFGGTNHINGDRGAITVHQRPTATGWSSTTLSLDGGGSILTTVVCVPDDYPTVVLTGSQGYTSSTSLSWGFTATDPDAAGGGSLATFCSIGDPLSLPEPQPCTSPITLTGLADGQYAIKVQARAGDGRESEWQSTTAIVDTVDPTVTMSKPPLFHVTQSATPTWAGQDGPLGRIASYQLRSRRTPLRGDASAWSGPTLLPSTVNSQTFTELIPGSTYCYGVRAIDRATNTGPWRTRCTSIPLDDRVLNRSDGWAEREVEDWYQGTAVQTRARGATLSKSATARRLGLVALKCPACGRVAIIVAGTRVATVNLASSTTARRIVALPAIAETTGTVTLKVVSDGMLVRIDALSVSRT